MPSRNASKLAFLLSVNYKSTLYIKFCQYLSIKYFIDGDCKYISICVDNLIYNFETLVFLLLCLLLLCMRSIDRFVMSVVSGVYFLATTWSLMVLRESTMKSQI